MTVQHPLLIKIDIDNCINIHNAFNKILDLGLNAKIHDTTIIVTYPKKMKYTNDDYILHSRGIIIDYNNKKVINHSLRGCLDIDTFINKVYNWNSVVIEECLDGVLINIYYHNNTWNISTKFCVNADESKFKTKKTFHELFNEANIIDYNLLDKSYTYSFLLQHTESRNVSLINNNKIYHLESTNNITGEKVQIKIPNIKTPKLLKFRNIINILGINNINELKDKVNQLHWTNPGYILYSEDRKYRSKLENINFTKVLNLVKDQSNIQFLILESLYKKKNISELLKYFPEYSSLTIETNNIFSQYTVELHNKYITCKVNNQYLNLENKFRKALCDVHNIFKNKRKSGDYEFKITYNIVCDTVRNYDTAYLYSILYG